MKISKQCLASGCRVTRRVRRSSEAIINIYEAGLKIIGSHIQYLFQENKKPPPARPRSGVKEKIKNKPVQHLFSVRSGDGNSFQFVLLFSIVDNKDGRRASTSSHCVETKPKPPEYDCCAAHCHFVAVQI